MCKIIKIKKKVENRNMMMKSVKEKIFFKRKKKKKPKAKFMDANITKESVTKDALSAKNFSLVGFAMTLQNLKMKWTPKKITR